MEAQTRISKRVPCNVRVGERRYVGMVLNLSQGGLFVQTGAEAARGASVALELNAAERGPGVPIEATVVWRRVVPQALRATVSGGMGVRIERADENYFRLLAGWMREEIPTGARAAAPAPAPEPPLPIFRVHLREAGSPRTVGVRVGYDF